MFKLLTIGIGFYILYRLFRNDLGLDEGPKTPPIEEEGDYIDYEEVD